jgi:hypothetical protein
VRASIPAKKIMAGKVFKINEVGMVKSDFYQHLVEVANVGFFVYYYCIKTMPDIPGWSKSVF